MLIPQWIVFHIISVRFIRIWLIPQTVKPPNKETSPATVSSRMSNIHYERPTTHAKSANLVQTPSVSH